MKRILSAIMVVAMLVTLLPSSIVHAQDGPYLEVSSVTGAPGEQVTVEVSLKNSLGFGGMAYDVYYDNAVLKPVEYALGLGESLCTDSGLDIYDDHINFQYAGTSNVEGDGVLVTVVFEIIAANACTTEIEVIPEEGTTFYYDGRKEVDFELEAVVGTVTVATAEAAADPCLEVSSAQGTLGDQVTIEVSLKNSLGFGGMAYDVYYDNTILKPVDYALGLGENICTDSGLDIYDDHINFQYAGTSNVEGDGVLVTVVFEIVAANACTTEIEVIPEEGSTFYYEGRTEIDFTLEPAVGTVSVAAASCTHEDKTEVPSKSPDCLNPGNNKYYVCSCGMVFKADGITETTVEAETIPALGHTEVTDAAVAATCTETGLTEGMHCSVCGEVLVAQEVIPALGHDYEAVTYEPTCAEMGYTEYTCSRCGDSYKDNYVDVQDHADLDPKDHCCDLCGILMGECYDNDNDHYCDWCGASLSDHADDDKDHFCDICGERMTWCVDNNNDHYCDLCGAVVSEHTEEVVPGYAADCVNDGLTEGKICSICGEVLVAQEVIPALGHDYEAVVTVPTCTEQGYTTYTCSRCGDSYVADYVDALDHSYSTEWSKGEEGHWHKCENCEAITEVEDHIYEADKCTICGYERAHVHNLTLVEAKAATCTEAGNKAYYTCSGCENWFEDASGAVVITDKTSVVVAALGHEYETVVTAPTCTEQGYTTYTCSRCGDSYVDNYVAATGHSFGEWTETKAATCTDAGEETRDCANCDVTETRAIEALGHDYQAVETAPTCTEQGCTTYTCSRCGDSYKDNYVDALGHIISEDWSMGEETHWHECERCHVKADEAAHDDADQNEECDICGYQLDHVHNLSLVNAVEATCTEHGNKAYYVCAGCENWFEDAFGTIIIEDKSSVEILPLGHEYEATVIEPTCEEEGYTVYTCVRCSDTYMDNYVDATGHSFGEWTETKAATCTEAGEETRTCANCDVTETREIAALDHSFTNYVSNGDATCAEDGTKTAKCDRCDAEDTVTDVGSHENADHRFGDWVEGDGKKHRECEVCGTTETKVTVDDGEVEIEAPEQPDGEFVVDPVEPSDDNYEDVKDDVEAASKGKVVMVYDINLIGPDGNAIQISGEIQIKLPVVGDMSFKVYRVNDDGTVEDMLAVRIGNFLTFTTDHLSYYAIVEDLGHQHNLTLVEAKDATCTEAGNKSYYTCGGCEDWFEDASGSVIITDKASVVIPALGHAYEAVVTAPTCTEQGYTTYTCSACGDSYVDDYVDAVGHNFKDGICTECGAEDPNYEEDKPTVKPNLSDVIKEWIEKWFGKDEEEEDKCEHSYVDEVKDPTCTEKGYTKHTCEKCGHSYIDNYVKATGHDYENGVCTECGHKYHKKPIWIIWLDWLLKK